MKRKGFYEQWYSDKQTKREIRKTLVIILALAILTLLLSFDHEQKPVSHPPAKTESTSITYDFYDESGRWSITYSLPADHPKAKNATVKVRDWKNYE